MGKYIIGLFMLISFLMMLFLLKVSYDEDKKEMKDYRILKSMYAQSVSGKVVSTKKTMNKYCKGRFLVNLNTNKFSLNRNTTNKEYIPSDIEYFLQKNDSIYKPAYNDSIYVFRKNKVYYFIDGLNL